MIISALRLFLDTIITFHTCCSILEVIWFFLVPETKPSKCGRSVLAIAKRPSLATRTGSEGLLSPTTERPLSAVLMTSRLWSGMWESKLQHFASLPMTTLSKQSYWLKARWVLNSWMLSSWSINLLQRQECRLWSNWMRKVQMGWPITISRLSWQEAEISWSSCSYCRQENIFILLWVMIIGSDAFLYIRMENSSILLLMIKLLGFGTWTLGRRRRKWRLMSILSQQCSLMGNMGSLGQLEMTWLLRYGILNDFVFLISGTSTPFLHSQKTAYLAYLSSHFLLFSLFEMELTLFWMLTKKMADAYLGRKELYWWIFAFTDMRWFIMLC